MAYLQHIKIQIQLLINRCLYFLCSKENMIRNLIAPYEGRSWAQTNWILVRIWKVWNYDVFFVVLFFTVNDIFDFSLSLVFVLFRNDMKNKF